MDLAFRTPPDAALGAGVDRVRGHTETLNVIDNTGMPSGFAVGGSPSGALSHEPAWPSMAVERIRARDRDALGMLSLPSPAGEKWSLSDGDAAVCGALDLSRRLSTGLRVAPVPDPGPIRRKVAAVRGGI